MNRRPVIAALAASGLALAALVTSSAPASAATLESCTISTRVGDVHVAFFTSMNTLTKTGYVEIIGGPQAVLLVTDRVAWQRGAAGMVPPNRVRQWSVHYPVSFYTHARVVVRGSDGRAAGCTTS